MRRFFTTLLIGCCIASAAPAAGTRIEHDIDVTLSPQSGEISLSDRVRVAQRELYRFQLAPWLNIDAALVNGTTVEVQRDNAGYAVRLPDAGSHELEFSISGNLPLRGAGEAPAGPASSASDGSFLPASASWIAHDFSEPMVFRMQVEVPREHRAVATARLVNEVQGDGFYRASFEQLQPGEAPSLFAGPYQVREREAPGLRLRTYFHAGLDDHAQAYLQAAESYIRRYEREIGEYPYADFHIVSAPLPVGLGFPGLTYVDRRIIPLPFMRSRSLAHEVVHNWWGNAVAVDYARGNWAEGLTTYMADYGLERDKGEAEARNMRVNWLRDYAALPSGRDRAVREFTSKQHQAAQVIGYNKVAFIFHMLREEIGVRAFDDGIRRFWQRHRSSTASWQDLQRAFEQASSRGLDWFFRQWLDQAGAPRLSLGSHRVDKVEDGYRTRIEILQPVPGYKFSLAVTLATEAGEERRRLFVEERLTRLEWTTPQRPLSIHFDPHTDLFRRLQPDETPPILRDITLNPASVVAIAGSEPGFDTSARALAERLLDLTPRFLQPGQARAPAEPLLLIADSEQLPAQLERLQLRVPANLPDVAHDAAAWTARLANNTPVLVVTAANTDALRALLRPLPHYGGQSYVLFEAGRAQSRGLWPLSRGALYRELVEAN